MSSPNNVSSLPIKGVKYRSMNHNNGVAKVPLRVPDGAKPSMPDFRRKYLEAIRKKEAERVQKEKIGKILLRKLAIKFGRCVRFTVLGIISHRLLSCS
jgi:hypothetical protein